MRTCSCALISLPNGGPNWACRGIKRTIGWKQNASWLKKLAGKNPSGSAPTLWSGGMDPREALFHFFQKPVDREWLWNKAAHAGFLQELLGPFFVPASGN